MLEMKKKSKLFFDCLLILAIVCSFSVSLYFSVAENSGEWLQRSGSLIVLFSVVLEILQTLAKQPIPSDWVFINNVPAATSPPVSKTSKWFHKFARFGIVIGTLIWGYGDLLFEFLYLNLRV